MQFCEYISLTLTAIGYNTLNQELVTIGLKGFTNKNYNIFVLINS